MIESESAIREKLVEFEDCVFWSDDRKGVMGFPWRSVDSLWKSAMLLRRRR